MPVDPRLAEREREALLREVEETISRPLRGESGVFQLPEPPAREAPALIVHTSGTTGRPRPVDLTYGNVRANARGLGRRDRRSATTSAGSARCRSATSAA